GMIALQASNYPLPEGKRLRVRIVDPEDADALADPEAEHVMQLVPQDAPRLRLEIERVDVLVLLRRVLRILDAAVRPVPEPFRMLGHVRMVGRALKGNVERD